MTTILSHYPYGRAKSVTRSVGVGFRKKPKDLSPHESDECGHGKGGGVYTTLQSDLGIPKNFGDDRKVVIQIKVILVVKTEVSVCTETFQD